jgi:hypothetical protein
MAKITLKLALLAGLLTVAPPAEAARFGFRGGVFAGPAYGPWGYGPYGGYYGGYPYALRPNAGQIKIDTARKDAQVFINGAYAGTVKETKSLWLRQGTYDLELRSGGEKFATKVFVINGKTLKVSPDQPNWKKS